MRRVLREGNTKCRRDRPSDRARALRAVDLRLAAGRCDHRDRRGGREADVPGRRQREAGVRHGCHTRGADVAPRPVGDGRQDPGRQRAGRRALPRRLAGCRLPRPPRHHRRDVGRAHGALQPGRALESGGLQAVDSVQRLHVPDHARRHQARRVRAPAHEPGGRARPPARHARPERPRVRAAVPDAHRVLGLRLRRPGRAHERHRGAREPDGLRGRRREHARHGLLGRRVRLLRAVAEPRRLRRDRDDRAPAVGEGPQGRHDGHLLRRHQPAVHRAAATRRTSPRSHRCRCSTRPPRRCTRAASSTPASPWPGPTSASTRRSPPGPTRASPTRTSGSRAATPRARPTRRCTARRRT